MTLIKLEVNCETGEETIVPLSADELAQREKDKAAHAAQKAEQDALDVEFLANLATAQAKLEAVGLTRAEIKAIRKDK